MVMMTLKLKEITYILILTLLFEYIAWEIYWYFKVGLSCIKWHSHIMLFLTPIILIIIYNDFKNKKPTKLNVRFLLVFITLFVWESFLTFSGINKTQHEKLLGYNVEISGSNNFQQYYHINYPNEKIEIKKPEFTFSRTSNKLGYSDYEIQLRKSKKEIRMLCLGDSFTEGDGAPFEKSYVFQLRNKFLNPYNYYVFNAGKCGSDPFFNFVNYRDILNKYDFDIVLQTLSSSDFIDDINIRGGMERFKKKYVVEFRKPNTVLKHIYIMSFVGRSFLKAIGYNELLTTKKVSNEDCQKTIDLMTNYSKTIEKNNAKLVLILLPNKKEVQEDYPIFLKETIEKIKKIEGLYIIDLREFYRKEIAKSNSNFIQDNWWNEDWHHTPQGYQMMAKSIYLGLKNHKLIKP